MIQTVEAFVNENGKMELLAEIHLKKRQRALMMILDELKKERLFTVSEKMQKANLFRNIEGPVEWQKFQRQNY